MAERKNHKLYYFIIIAVFLGINLYLAGFHEPWRDEAQVWLLSRDVPAYMLPLMSHYEGHPCLWHLIMSVPLIVDTAPIAIQTGIAFVITLLALIALLFRTQLPLYMKAVVAISPIFTYYMPVVARNYCMVVLFLVLLGTEFKGRLLHPWRYGMLIALLTQSHSVMIMTAFALSLCFMTDLSLNALKSGKRDLRSLVKACLPLSLPLAGGLFWLAQMRYNVDDSGLLHMKTASLRRTIEKMGETLSEILDRFFASAKPMGKVLVAALVIFLVMSLFVLSARRMRGFYYGAVVILMTMTFQLWFYTMVYGWSVQKIICFMSLILWWLIICCDGEGIPEEAEGSASVKEGIGHGEDPNAAAKDSTPPGGDIHAAVGYSPVISFIWNLRYPAFAIALLVTLAVGIKKDIIPDIEGPYSNGRTTADFINREIDYKSGNCVIIADNRPEVTAILPYTYGLAPVYGLTGEPFTYVRWDAHWNDRGDNETFMSVVNGYKESGYEVYVISCPERSYIEDAYDWRDHYELIYETETPSIKGEDYRIYRVP